MAWADANSDESCSIVSVKVATFDLSAAVAVSRLVRASTVSAWWFGTLVESNHQSETVDALANLETDTAVDRTTVATLTDTIAQLSSELASAQAKLISSLLDNQRLLKRLSDKEGSWNTSGGVTNRKTSRGGAAGPWDGQRIHYCHTHGHKCPHPSLNFPEPGTGHIKNATKKDTRGGSDKEYKKK